MRPIFKGGRYEHLSQPADVQIHPSLSYLQTAGPRPKVPLIWSLDVSSQYQPRYPWSRPGYAGFQLLQILILPVCSHGQTAMSGYSSTGLGFPAQLEFKITQFPGDKTARETVSR